MTSVLFGAASGIALIDWLTSKGQTLSVSDNVITQMSAEANFLSETKCISRVVGSQSIIIDPGGGAYRPATRINKGSCLSCINFLKEIVAARRNLEAEAGRKNRSYNPQNASENMGNAMTGSSYATDITTSENIGACDMMCKDVLVYNVQQSQTFNAKTTCQIQNSDTNSLTQTINGSVNSLLKNQEDFMGQLSNAFTSNTESMSAGIASIMDQTINTVVQQELNNSAINVQEFNIGIKSGAKSGEVGVAHSIFVNSSDQNFNSDAVATMTVTNTVNNTMRQSADYSISQTLLNKNDTIGDLSGDFLQIIETIADLMQTLTVQFLVIIGAVMSIIMLLIGSMYMFNKGFRSALDFKVNRQINKYATSDMVNEIEGAYQIS